MNPVGSEPPHPPWRLDLLGPVTLRGPEPARASLVLRSQKAVALLAYLLLQGDRTPTSRERLATLLWPESNESRARASLRQTLRLLRESLGKDALPSEGHSGVRAAATHVACDADRFDTLLKKGRPRDALEVYRGSLMDGFFLHGSYEFQDWLEERRAAVGRTAARVAWTMAEQAEREGRPTDAASLAMRALSLSPFDEHSVQRLMRLLDRVEDRAGCMRAYRGLQAHLAREYGAVPAPETTRIFLRARARTEPSAPLASVGGRRTTAARRHSDRRTAEHGPPGSEERRSGSDRRRTDDRRSNEDRRAPL